MTLLLWDIINKYIYWQLYKYCVISSSVRQYYYLLGFIISTTCKWNMIVFLLTSVAKLREVLDILFLSNHNVHKSLHGLWVSAPDPLIDRFYYQPWIKTSEAQKQSPHKLLWMLWFDEKCISSIL